MKVSIVVGTRPQIIKSAPVYHAFVDEGVECELVNTGQHYDYEMNQVFFRELELPEPAADLNVGAASPTEQVSAIISGLGSHFAAHRPDVAISPGDTNSALAAGIASSKAGIPLAHLESGCRSNDFRMAEETNRRVLDHMAQVLLCPTAGCVKNARAEKVLARSVTNVGDTMYDSILKFLPSLEMMDAATKYGLDDGEYAFMTLHRAETVDDRGALKSVVEAVSSLDTPVVFSVHPRTRERLKEFGISPGPNFTILEPLPYVESLSLVNRSRAVITDSGGLQKEAYWLGKPVVIPRDETEWREIVDAGAAFLAGEDGSMIGAAFRKALKVKRASFSATKRIFGRGDASARVVEAVAKFFSQTGSAQG